MRTCSKTRLAPAELEGGVDSATERWLHLATPPQTMGRRDLGAAGELANRSWRSERAYADLPRSFWLPIQRATSLVLGTSYYCDLQQLNVTRTRIHLGWEL